MSPVDILARLGQIVSQVSCDDSRGKWNAKQWREFGRQTNTFIQEGWQFADCSHDGLRFKVATGERCGICMRPIEESNGKEAVFSK